MNPALMVKLRPSGPWRIGPDSGARNRVDAIYHSDSLYAAVAQAMARLGALEEWLDATARAAAPAICFSSCFPLVDEIPFVTPPRTIWPPGAASLSSGRVRWKSARFVPVSMVREMLSGNLLDENLWTLDGESGCLMPLGKQGPFRASLRWSAAVDRLSGAAERHAAACLEFRPGAGFWTVASFASEAARDEWQERVKSAFRLLADSGFGGKRSRGWGRAEAPEFSEGALPEVLMGGREPGAVPEARSPEAPAAVEQAQSPDVFPPSQEPPQEEPPAEEPPSEPELPPPDPEPEIRLPEAAESHVENVAAQPIIPGLEAGSSTPGGGAGARRPQWLLSLFSPSPADSVEWSRGNYSLIERGGRVESPSGAGSLKKQVRMVEEGSVLYAAEALRGAAPDVAPDGFAHPVFRAGFAVAIPLAEAS